MTGHTPTPWVYRPGKHDDWGWIRDADGNLAATARDGRVWSDQFDAYRSKKADPYEANAAFIVEAVNNYYRLRAELASARKALEFYANQYCEGLGTNPDDCGKFKSDDCGGCLAAAALGQPK